MLHTLGVQVDGCFQNLGVQFPGNLSPTILGSVLGPLICGNSHLDDQSSK